MKQQRMQFQCHYCQSKLIRRTSWLAHSFLRNEFYVCSNPVCNTGYSAHTELTHIINPSGMPGAADLPPPLPETPIYIRRMALRVHQMNQRTPDDGQMDLLDTEEPILEEYAP